MPTIPTQAAPPDQGVIDSIVASARAQAERVAGVAVRSIAAFSNPVDALQHLSSAERTTAQARDRLIELQQAGLATSADFKMYDKLRTKLWLTQMEMWSLLIRVFATLGMQDSIVRLPHPQIMPEVPRTGTPSPTPQPESQSLSGLQAGRNQRRDHAMRGLGNPAVVAAPVPAVVYFAGAAIVLLTALAIAAAAAGLVLTAYEIAQIFIVQASAEQLAAFYAARLGAYRQCLASGRTPQECSSSVMQLLPEPPPPPGLQPNPFAWLGYVAAGAGILALVGLGVYAYRGSPVRST